jgi:hypothetical protein
MKWSSILCANQKRRGDRLSPRIRAVLSKDQTFSGSHFLVFRLGFFNYHLNIGPLGPSNWNLTEAGRMHPALKSQHCDRELTRGSPPMIFRPSIDDEVARFRAIQRLLSCPFSWS